MAIKTQITLKPGPSTADIRAIRDQLHKQAMDEEFLKQIQNMQRQAAAAQLQNQALGGYAAQAANLQNQAFLQRGLTSQAINLTGQQLMGIYQAQQAPPGNPFSIFNPGPKLGKP